MCFVLFHVIQLLQVNDILFCIFYFFYTVYIKNLYSNNLNVSFVIVQRKLDENMQVLKIYTCTHVTRTQCMVFCLIIYRVYFNFLVANTRISLLILSHFSFLRISSSRFIPATRIDILLRIRHESSSLHLSRRRMRSTTVHVGACRCAQWCVRRYFVKKKLAVSLG